MSESRRPMTFRRADLKSADAAEAKVAGTITERLALVRALSLAAWANTGKPFPTYDRSQIPVRIVSLSERRDRD